jgi:chromosome segregation ATPase
MNSVTTSLALSLVIASTSSMAVGLDAAQSIQSKTNAASASSQKRIDASAEKTLTLKAEIEQLQEEVNNLQVYRQHLTSLVNSQQQEVISLERQIDEIKSTRQGIVPLMYQMIDGLKQITAEDVPIKLEQRNQRIAKLEKMMVRADVSDAEKYRRILEAYQIELDYGTKLGLYQGQLSIDGESRQADVLYLGRLSLVARSLNGNSFWAWDQNAKQWSEVDPSMKSELDKAFSMAAQQVAPSLITLPVSLKVAEVN